MLFRVHDRGEWGIALRGDEQHRLEGVHGLFDAANALNGLLGLTRTVTPEVPEDLDPEDYYEPLYRAYPVLLEQPELLIADWQQDSHEELCLAAIELMLSEKVLGLAREAALADHIERARVLTRFKQSPEGWAVASSENDRVEEWIQVAWNLLVLRVDIHRLARVLNSASLNEKLEHLDQVYRVIGERLVATLDQWDVESRVLVTMSPAAGKCSGYEVLEDLTEVVDATKWWGYHARPHVD